jgi:hypothetical protein
MKSTASAAALMPSEPKGFSSNLILPFYSIKITFYSTSFAMKNALKFALLSLLFVLQFSEAKVNAQVSSYVFTKSIGTYTEITGGTLLASGSAIDNNNYAITGLPFDFYFNGNLYNSFNINSNGYITFGSVPPVNLQNPISNFLSYEGAISAWGRDANGISNIGGLTSELRWEALGNSPNREIVVQWKNVRPTQSTSTTIVPYINFQIRLKETTSTRTDIIIVYGSNGMAVGSTNTSSTVQIGLRGSTNSDFKNLTNSNTSLFQNAMLGTSNSELQNFSTINSAPGMPPSGLQYLFSTAEVALTAPAVVCQPQSEPTTVHLSGIPNYIVEYQLNGTSQSLTLDATGTGNINLGNISNNNQSILVNSMKSQDGLTIFPQNVQKNIVSSGYCSSNNTSLTDFMLVQNVTTVDNNAANKTIQIQFDLSWGYSWRDNINWDAAWVFAKYKGTDGIWRHAKLNTAGYSIASSKVVNITSDRLGAFIYSGFNGEGRFEALGTQLQWNYGLDGLTSVTGLEVRVFAVEMVYVPQGDFNVAKRFITNYNDQYDPWRVFSASGNNFPVINTRLTPVLNYGPEYSPTQIRIKGDAGIDSNNDGIVDITSYPTGYRPFYCFKFELSEQQYADFLNCLTSSQKTSLGVAGSGTITLTNNEFFSSTPNRACVGMNALRSLAFADWSGLRPMSILEMNKASYGPINPQSYWDWIFPVGNYFGDYYSIFDVGNYDSPNSNRFNSGSSYYGIDDLSSNAIEFIVNLTAYNFGAVNGNGELAPTGAHNVSGWNEEMMILYDQREINPFYPNSIRYVRSAE